jgi:diguanylate cyclase (GGDEF)-like protein
MNLTQLILLLAIASALISLANVVHASYQVLRQQLIENTLESNHAYASKLAVSVEDFIESVQQQLKISARVLSDNLDNQEFLDAETDRVLSQTNSFNSVVILDHNVTAISTSPASLSIRGKVLDTFGATESIRLKQPLITKPYISSVGNLVVVISHPIFLSNGDYAGAIAGTFYLKQESVLNRLLTSHYYDDGSYLYVVDRERRLIFHPDNTRVGTVVGENKIVDDVILGNSGRLETENSQGIEMLAGYAPIASTGWGIVTQRPKHHTLASLDSLVIDVLKYTLPITILSFIIIWWCTKLISKPLHQLADGARKMTMPDTDKEINKVHSWYYESSELKKAMLVGIRLLQKNINKLVEASQTDPLTKLGNRRTLELALDTWKASSTPFAIISADIDYFKKINDAFGHDTGDLVLQKLAGMMQELSRTNDVICRVGGEEFLILLPNTNIEHADQIAERLRLRVEQTEIEPIGHMTISLGVAQWQPETDDVLAALKVADEMLYKAKHNGRNRVESARHYSNVAHSTDHTA